MVSDRQKMRRAILRAMLKSYRLVPGERQFFEIGDHLAALGTKYPSVDIGILMTELAGEQKIVAVETKPEPSKLLRPRARGVVVVRLNPERVTCVEDEVGLELWKWVLLAGLFVVWLIIAAYVAAQTSYRIEALALPKSIFYPSALVLWAASSRIVLGKEDWRLLLRIIRDILVFWHEPKDTK